LGWGKPKGRVSILRANLVSCPLDLVGASLIEADQPDQAESYFARARLCAINCGELPPCRPRPKFSFLFGPLGRHGQRPWHTRGSREYRPAAWLRFS
jgi:hypothetical protein